MSHAATFRFHCCSARPNEQQPTTLCSLGTRAPAATSKQLTAVALDSQPACTTAAASAEPLAARERITHRTTQNQLQFTQQEQISTNAKSDMIFRFDAIQSNLINSILIHAKFAILDELLLILFLSYYFIFVLISRVLFLQQ